MSYNYQAQKPRPPGNIACSSPGVRGMAEEKKFCPHCSPETGCHDPMLCEYYNTESCPIKGVCLEHSAKGLVFMSTKLLVVAVGRRFRNETMEAILTDYPQLTERHVWFAAGYVTGQYVGEEKMIWG